MAWLEQGGVWAIANLRGGGEYGEDWHKSGMLGNKQNVFDDFIYAARYLIDQKWTSSKHLAVYGGSNGGLLMGAVFTQAPELFGAVVCAVPLLDMIRFPKVGIGTNWVPEYGDPSKEDAFKWLYAYSPYHHVVEGTKYPPLLMLSADSDDRVDPMHARKFVAEVQWATGSNAPVYLRIQPHSGHAGNDTVKEQIELSSDMFLFLWSVLK
jgi:prolyl oligopeptidase